MKTEIDETRLENVLETFPPPMSGEVDSRLKSAPWTKRGAAFRRAPWIAALALLVTAAAALATPPGRAWAQGVLQFFSRGDSDTLAYTAPTQSWVESPPGSLPSTVVPTPQAAFAAQCGDYAQAHCSVEKVRSMAGFTVTELATIPEGLYFAGATGSPDRVFLSYDTPDHSGFLDIFESPWTGSTSQTSWLIGPNAVVEKVSIGNVMGEYVKGSYSIYNGQGPAKWDPNLDVQTLHWIKDGIFFEMQCSGKACKQDMDSLAELASNMTTRPVSALAPTMPPAAAVTPYDFSMQYPLTLAQAEQKAGYPLHLPARLPDYLAFSGSNFDVQHNIAILFYRLLSNDDPGNSRGLTFKQQPMSGNSDCELCGFVVGSLADVNASYPLKIVGDAKSIEPVQIGSISGEYVEGMWEARDDTDMKWFAEPNVKILRWQENGMAFEMTYWGQDIDKAMIIAIAESLK
jgi:hypothetical protein